MHSLDGVRERGFKRWYERQLIESHAYFVTCFVSMIVVAAALEVFGMTQPDQSRLPMLALALAGCFLAVFAWGQYKAILENAERIAESATCTRCGSYGRFSVTDWGPQGGATRRSAASAPQDSQPWMRVRCRKCSHEWLIE